MDNTHNVCIALNLLDCLFSDLQNKDNLPHFESTIQGLQDQTAIIESTLKQGDICLDTANGYIEIYKKIRSGLSYLKNINFLPNDKLDLLLRPIAIKKANELLHLIDADLKTGNFVPTTFGIFTEFDELLSQFELELEELPLSNSTYLRVRDRCYHYYIAHKMQRYIDKIDQINVTEKVYELETLARKGQINIDNMLIINGSIHTLRKYDLRPKIKIEVNKLLQYSRVEQAIKVAELLNDFYNPSNTDAQFKGKSKNELFALINSILFEFAQNKVSILEQRNLIYDDIAERKHSSNTFKETVSIDIGYDYYNRSIEELMLYNMPLTKQRALALFSYALKSTLESFRIIVTPSLDDEYLETGLNTFCFTPFESMSLKDEFAPIFYRAIGLKVVQSMASIDGFCPKLTRSAVNVVNRCITEGTLSYSELGTSKKRLEEVQSGKISYLEAFGGKLDQKLIDFSDYPPSLIAKLVIS